MPSASSRDISIDMIKGLGCLCIILAHLPIFTLTLPQNLIIQLAGPGTVFFFSTAGITAAIQVRRYPAKSLLLYFGVLSILGSCWNIMVHGDIKAFASVEIFQIITLGSALICWLERNKPCPQKTLLLLSCIFGGFKFLSQAIFPEFDGGGWLLVASDYIPYHDPDNLGKRSFPGFPIFPWISVFPLGLFCYRATKQQNAIGMMLMVITAVVSTYLGSNPIEKWDTSIAFLAHCYAYIFLSFWLFSGGRTETNRIGNLFAWTGKSSLTFFFFHPLALLGGLIIYNFSNLYVAWFCAAVLAYFVTKGAVKLKPWKIFSSAWSWVVLGIILFSMPIMDTLLDTPTTGGISRLVAFIIGMVLCINVPKLAELTKKAVS